LVAVIAQRGAAVAVATGASGLRCLLAVVVVAQPALAVHRRRRLRRLAAALGEVPPVGSLEAALARALGDREVRVAYWLPDPGRYVDAAGNPVEVDGDWSVTLRRDEQRLAAVRLSTPARDSVEVEHVVGSAARLAIDNERLQAQLRAHLVDLRASRQRIIAAGDDTRRRVERDIHDLVQSELLGALFSLAGSGPSSGAPGSAATTEPDPAPLAGQVRALVTGLRQFSQGIYPSVLDHSGLGPALEALTYEAPVLIDLDCEIQGRLPLDVEHAAYLLVRNAVMAATCNVSVRVAPASPGAVITITGSQVPIREDLQDRVGALGGRIHVADGSIRAELPCG
jgi:signal transduction histidine kinase